MVETLHLQPPPSGPQSDPLLFGVAEALALLFPVESEQARERATAPEPPQEDTAEQALAA